MQQGDPLGPLGFALTLQPLLEHLQADISGLRLNAWYLDDGTLRLLLLPCALWSMKVLPCASISTTPNLSSTSQGTLTQLCLSSHQTFPPPAEVSLFWVVPLAHQTTARIGF